MSESNPPTHPRSSALLANGDDERLVTVCDKCRTAACWYGQFMCQESRDAGTVDVPVSVLRRERREHSDYWTERAVNEGGVR